MKKKLLACVAAVAAMALSAVMLVGCGSDEAASGDKFVVGFDAGYPPYGYVGEDGEYTGFDLELAQEVCNRNGWTFEATPIDWDAKDALLDQGSITCVWNGFTYEGREDGYAWSDKYMKNGQVVVVKADSDIKSVDDLAGKNVVTQVESAGLEVLETEFADLNSAYNAAVSSAAAAEREVGGETDEELKNRLAELGITEENIDVAAARKETEFYRTQAQLQEKEIYARKISLAEHKAKTEDPCEIAGKLSEAASAYTAKTRQFNAVVKAIDALGTAGQNLRGGVAPFLSDGACRRMNAATGGKYAGLRVDGELSAVCIAERAEK